MDDRTRQNLKLGLATVAGLGLLALAVATLPAPQRADALGSGLAIVLFFGGRVAWDLASRERPADADRQAMPAHVPRQLGSLVSPLEWTTPRSQETRRHAA